MPINRASLSSNLRPTYSLINILPNSLIKKENRVITEEGFISVTLPAKISYLGHSLTIGYTLLFRLSSINKIVRIPFHHTIAFTVQTKSLAIAITAKLGVSP